MITVRRFFGRLAAVIASAYFTSMPGRSEPEPSCGIKSSASSLVVSNAGEKGNLSIATAVPTVIPSITKQTTINAGWMSLFFGMVFVFVVI